MISKNFSSNDLGAVRQKLREGFQLVGASVEKATKYVSASKVNGMPLLAFAESKKELPQETFVPTVTLCAGEGEKISDIEFTDSPTKAQQLQEQGWEILVEQEGKLHGQEMRRDGDVFWIRSKEHSYEVDGHGYLLVKHGDGPSHSGSTGHSQNLGSSFTGQLGATTSFPSGGFHVLTMGLDEPLPLIDFWPARETPPESHEHLSGPNRLVAIPRRSR